MSVHLFVSFPPFCETGFECAVEEMKVLSVAEAQSREVAAAEALLQPLDAAIEWVRLL